MGPMPTADRLAAPTMPAEPSPADLGALQYYYLCMSCHGDRGQGLTEEFRSLWAPGDQNCWQGKCHAANHPPDGFEIARYVPPVIGEGTLASSLGPQQLYNYISTQMPRQAPGTLTADVYWQLTAFLLRANGVDFDEQALGLEAATRAPDPGTQAEATATVPPVPPSEMAPHDDDPGTALWAVPISLFVVAVIALIWAIRHRRSAT